MQLAAILVLMLPALLLAACRQNPGDTAPRSALYHPPDTTQFGGGGGGGM